MSNLLPVLQGDDNREQVEIDNDLPVMLKLTCGAVSGACAQTSELWSKQQHA